MTAQKHILLTFGLMFSVISFFACKITERKPVQAPPGFDWQGHRGCRGLLPENSLPAFLHALEYPEVQTLELDLAVSKDGQLIVSHEPWFNPAICRQPNGDSISKKDAERFLIYEMTAAEIRGFDCGSAGNPRFPQQKAVPVYKPTFREVVEAVQQARPEKNIHWNIEIKSRPEWDGVRTPPIEEFVEILDNELKALNLEEQVIVQSFDVRPLQILHQRNPKLRLALLIENLQGFDANLDRLGFVPAAYSPYYVFVNKKLVRKCREKNIQLVPWTVNDVPAMRRLIRLGVDGIITDYPNLILEVGRE
ncbi:MAG: glycerophosphodiester phosphodiesterase [Lewinellaceae bacterium]|nr:glycerophosphodiester phosphodiesterase [Lewinellaceae bacterium]